MKDVSAKLILVRLTQLSEIFKVCLPASINPKDEALRLLQLTEYSTFRFCERFNVLIEAAHLLVAERHQSEIAKKKCSFRC